MTYVKQIMIIYYIESEDRLEDQAQKINEMKALEMSA